MAQSAGLTEGQDFFFVGARETGLTLDVPSVVLTREAFDTLLDQHDFATEKLAATERAFMALQAQASASQNLEVLLAEQRKNRWYIPLITGAGSFLGGYLAGKNQADTVTVIGGQ